MIVRGPKDGMRIECPLFPDSASPCWWHTQLGLKNYNPNRGSGIKVGVIDSGCGPHSNLRHVQIVGSHLNGIRDPSLSAGADVDDHGSHVTGIIGAQTRYQSDYSGFAPDCSLYHIRVFEKGQGASIADVAAAIDILSREYSCDLINLSLTYSEPSELVQDAIIDAYERGSLCICAAGNSAGAVEYPAAFEEAVAVSAIGLSGAEPAGTLSATRLPLSRDRFGHHNLYLSNFSCLGPEIACAAPGVGIILTIREGRSGQSQAYLAMDGTSMAAPMVCGTLAVLLANNPSYLGMPRNTTRSLAARQILMGHCTDVGLNINFQGRGIPALPPGVG